MAKNNTDHLEESIPRKGRKATAAEKAAAIGREALKAAAGDPRLNFIEFTVSDDTKPGSGPTRNDKSGRNDQKDRAPLENSVEGVPKKEASTESPASRIPDSVSERFIHIGNNFYFPDGTEAFSRENNRLVTRSENAVVIQSMVAIAQAESKKGAVKVGGSDFFRKEAWFAASLAGLQVEGYTPTELERERLARAIGRRDGKSPEKPSQARDDSRAAKPAEVSDLIVGKLVDHGVAPYEHKSKEKPSYFVRVETEQGDREIWGVDLERAFRQSLSTPGIGDEVGVRAVGRDPVTVRAANGRQTIDTHRNQWIVERKAFLDQRQHMAETFRNPAMDAVEGTRRHPELQGSYLQLQMGRAFAADKFANKEDREQFVEQLRTRLATNIEHGRPLEPVPLKTRERAPEPRVADRDYNPTR